MALTETQVRVLAVLADLRAMTVLQVRAETKLPESTVRTTLGQHAYLGLVRRSDQRPMRWRIAREGRAVINSRAYREYLPRTDATGIKGR